MGQTLDVHYVSVLIYFLQAALFLKYSTGKKQDDLASVALSYYRLTDTVILLIQQRSSIFFLIIQSTILGIEIKPDLLKRC